MVYGRSVTVQRHWHSGNVGVLQMTMLVKMVFEDGIWYQIFDIYLQIKPVAWYDRQMKTSVTLRVLCLKQARLEFS